MPSKTPVPNIRKRKLSVEVELKLIKAGYAYITLNIKINFYAL